MGSQSAQERAICTQAIRAILLIIGHSYSGDLDRAPLQKFNPRAYQLVRWSGPAR
jgi:hypothetical protein